MDTRLLTELTEKQEAVKKAPRYKKPTYRGLFWYEATVLNPTQYRIWAVSVFFFFSGIVGKLSAPDALRNVWTFTFLASVTGIGWAAYNLVTRYFRLPKISAPISKRVPELISKAIPSVLEENYGYEIVRFKPLDDGYLYSPLVDAYLATNADIIALRADSQYGNEVHSRLRQNAALNSTILRATFREARRSHKMFHNERKIGLASNIVPGQKEITFFKTSYYSTYLTNERARRNFFESRGDAYEHELSNAANSYPIFEQPDEKRVTIKDIPSTYFSNHLGANVLGITSDKQLVLWEQGGSAIYSERLLAPTGSGSMDYADLRSARNLQHLIVAGMRRELWEESTKAGAAMPDAGLAEVKVLGYFRWLGRGGLPGFVGIARLSRSFRELYPNKSEVIKSNSQDCKTLWPARSLADLADSVRVLIEEKDRYLSLPLYVCLRALDVAIKNEPNRITELLFPTAK